MLVKGLHVESFPTIQFCSYIVKINDRRSVSSINNTAINLIERHSLTEESGKSQLARYVISSRFSESITGD